ncbi:DedA family protein [Pseudomonas sp. NPDC007930]|uniref:DedA family protein n=1 Tax=Pseudomonas sp. NPDC007930 TaxID=3364417 RepID=UPI0036E97BB0
MDSLQPLDNTGAVLLVFLNVLLEQLGLPLPAYPTLVVSGALALRDPALFAALWGLGVLACTLADASWYWAARRYAGWIQRARGRLFGAPRGTPRRVSAQALLLAKFVPGAGAWVTLAAGSQATPFGRFLKYSVAGSALWVGSALLLGAWLGDALLPWLARFGHYAAGALLLGLGVLAVAHWQPRGPGAAGRS